jgi:hypothetical protein
MAIRLILHRGNSFAACSRYRLSSSETLLVQPREAPCGTFVVGVCWNACEIAPRAPATPAVCTDAYANGVKPDATMAEAALDRHSRAVAEAMQQSAANRSNETELREDVHALIVEAAQDLYGLDALKTSAEQRAGRSAKPRSTDASRGGARANGWGDVTRLVRWARRGRGAVGVAGGWVGAFEGVSAQRCLAPVWVGAMERGCGCVRLRGARGCG